MTVELVVKGYRWSLIDGDFVLATGDTTADPVNVIMPRVVVQALIDSVNNLRRGDAG